MVTNRAKEIREGIRKVLSSYTAQKMKIPIKDFSSKCDQIHNFPWIWSHLPIVQ